MAIKARLEKLENTHNCGPCVMVWQYHDETSERAMARWLTANPSQPSPDKAGSRICLIRWAAPSAEGVAA
jgi:hypothetical protein